MALPRPSMFKRFKQEIFKKSLRWAVPTGVSAAVIKFLYDDLSLEVVKQVMPHDDVFKLFAATVSMLLVFRTVQALNVYREGARCIYQISGSWYDSASTLISFTRQASANPDLVLNFKHTIVRLFSLLNMLCLAELEDKKEGEKRLSAEFTTLDIEGLDRETLNNIRNSSCKPEVVCQQIQSLVVDSIGTGVMSVPPPILSRSFQDLGSGMMRFHEALNLSQVPLPCPVKLVTDFLLFMHAILAPCFFSSWTGHPVMAGAATFANVFVFSALNYLACEVENPFNGDANDINTRKVHYDLNLKLVALLKYADSRMPTTATKSMEKPIDDALVHMGSKNLGTEAIGRPADSQRHSMLWCKVGRFSGNKDAVIRVSLIDEFLDTILPQGNEESDTNLLVSEAGSPLVATSSPFGPAQPLQTNAVTSSISAGHQAEVNSDEAKRSLYRSLQNSDRKLETSDSREMHTTLVSGSQQFEVLDQSLCQAPVTPEVENAELQVDLPKTAAEVLRNFPSRAPVGKQSVGLALPTSERSLPLPEPSLGCIMPSRHRINIFKA